MSVHTIVGAMALVVGIGAVAVGCVGGDGTTSTESGAEGEERVAESVSALDGSLYYPLDLNREAREEYGSSAVAVAIGSHLYDWRAFVGFQLKSLDLQHAVASQYGPGWTLVAVGPGNYDWKAVQISALPYCVLPVMEVAYDRFFDVSGVADGVAKFQSALTTTQNWYQTRAGKTFRVLQPIIIPTTKSSSEWNNIANSTTNAPNRWDLLNEAIAQYQSQLPAAPSQVIIAAAPYTGASDSIWNGAATSYHFAVVAPRSTSVSCSPYGPLSALCANSTYALGHEIGHAFGLQHSCDIYPSDPSCGSSIMQTGEPWNAILLSGEISSLLATPYFP